MLTGHDPEEAARFILGQLEPRMYGALGQRIGELTARAIEADLSFMEETRVIHRPGQQDSRYYDEAAAFERLVDTLSAALPLSLEEIVSLPLFVDDFMDAHMRYLEYKGLVPSEE